MMMKVMEGTGKMEIGGRDHYFTKDLEAIILGRRS
jgi:hypothetical protein